jgi:hypothetical protein
MITRTAADLKADHCAGPAVATLRMILAVHFPCIRAERMHAHVKGISDELSRSTDVTSNKKPPGTARSDVANSLFPVARTNLTKSSVAAPRIQSGDWI